MARDPYGNVVQPEPQRIGSIQAAIAAGAALGDPRSPVVDEKAGVFAVVPKEYKVEDLERFLPRPLRIKESVPDGIDYFGSTVGGYCLGQVLELGPQRDRQPGDLASLRRILARPIDARLAG